jgi:hypothetical protein
MSDDVGDPSLSIPVMQAYKLPAFFPSLPTHQRQQARLLQSILLNIIPPFMDPSRIIRDGMESNPEEGTAVLQDETSSTFTLSDGRQLGYAQFGLLTGRPVFYCHGLPGCRIEAGHLHQAAVEAGVRLIAADRPGIGLSSPQPGRTILDHAGDLDQLARHLQVENFGVMVSAVPLPCPFEEAGY